LLVSNFNAQSNLQGTGTTIVRVAPNGDTSTFFQGAAGLGLTGALNVLKNGYVIVGNLPTTDGTGATAQPGSLLILNSQGKLVETISSSQLLNGPWEMAVNDQGGHAQLFVSNVLSGNVTRINLDVLTNGSAPKVVSETVIASGFAHRTDPAALVVGPTGLAYDNATGTLFVASTDTNAVYAIAHASSLKNAAGGTGKVIYSDSTHLHGPLGMVLAPNGDLIVADSDAVNADPNQPSEIVEFTQTGKFVSQFSIDPALAGPFGIAITTNGNQIQFAAVDDDTNQVNIWTLTQ
jgi:hypothetical protein